MIKALIIDANSMFHRAYHATVNQFDSETKKWVSVLPFFEQNNIKPCNATKLVLFWILSIIKKQKFDYFVACWDSHGKTTRSLLNNEYKSNRVHMPEEMRCQMNDVKEIIKICGGHNINITGVEADDIGGTINKLFNSHGIHTYLYSSDKDWTQLVDKDTDLCLIKNGGEKNWVYLTEENFKELSGYEGLTSKQVIDFKMLFGDTSDCYKGPIGQKSAHDLLLQYGSVEQIYKNLNNIKPALAEKIKSWYENKEQLALAKKMAEIDTNVKIDNDISKYKTNETKWTHIQDFIKRFNFSGFNKYVADKTPETINKIIIFGNTINNNKLMEEIINKEKPDITIHTGEFNNYTNFVDKNTLSPLEVFKEEVFHDNEKIRLLDHWVYGKQDIIINLTIVERPIDLKYLTKEHKVFHLNNKCVFLTHLWSVDENIDFSPFYNPIDFSEFKDHLNDFKKNMINKHKPDYVIIGNDASAKIYDENNYKIINSGSLNSEKRSYIIGIWNGDDFVFETIYF